MNSSADKQAEPAEKQYHQYFASRVHISITMPSSKRIRFVGGMYVTDKQDEIDFLDSEVKAGNQMISVDKNKLTVGETALDPLAAVKKKAVEDFLAAQAKAIDPTNDMGNSSAAPTAGLLTSRGIVAGSVTIQGKK